MKILLTISLMALSSCLFSQTVLKIKNAEENKIKIAELDSLYKSGFHADTSLAVFKTNPEEYYQAWVKFNQELGKFLSANEFYWEETTRGFNRIYFNKNGGLSEILKQNYNKIQKRKLSAKTTLQTHAP